MNNLNKKDIEGLFYYEPWILECNFDIFKNEITLKLLEGDIENGVKKETENFVIIFKEVSAFFFVNNDGEERFDFTKFCGKYTELVSIGYYEDGIGKILVDSDQSWANRYYAKANFVLDIGGWGPSLYIEAGVVEINGKAYHTKKLADSVV
jgi:hypothetical protein